MKRKFILSLTAYALLLLFSCAVLTGCGADNQLYSAALNSKNAANSNSSSSTSGGSNSSSSSSSSKSASSSSGNNKSSSSSSGSNKSSSSSAQITTLSVPSPLSYCGYAMTVGEQGLNTKKTPNERYYSIGNGVLDEEGWVDEYIKYIENNFDFKLVRTEKNGFEHQWFNHYFFEYTGSENVPEYDHWLSKDIKYNLYVMVSRYLDENRYGVSVYYAPQMTLVETDARTTKKLTNNGNASSGGSSGSSSSSSGSSGGSSYGSSSSGKKNCNYCGGTGKRDCHTCDGKGYEEIRTNTPNYSGKPGGGGSSTTRKTCSNPLCHGGKVDCSFCGGTGKK